MCVRARAEWRGRLGYFIMGTSCPIMMVICDSFDLVGDIWPVPIRKIASLQKVQLLSKKERKKVKVRGRGVYSANTCQ